VRQLYQLRAQEFAFRSFEIGFRPVEWDAARLIADPRAASVIDRVQDLLTRGLRWAQTGESPAEDSNEARVIFDAMMELSPRQGSPISSVEVGGRVAELLPNARATLTRTTRQLANESIGRIQSNRPRLNYVIVAGRVNAVNRDGEVTIRASAEQPPETTYYFNPEFLDAILDALAAQYDVVAIGQPSDARSEPTLLALERIDESSLSAPDQP
jgi:hypothetical protein